MTIDQALQHILEIGIGFDLIELRGLDERAYHGPAFATAIGAGEQVILAAEGHRSDRPFDRVCIELDAAIVDEAAERIPAHKSIADGFREPAAARNSGEFLIQ